MISLVKTSHSQMGGNGGSGGDGGGGNGGGAGFRVGAAEGAPVGRLVGETLGRFVGELEGETVGTAEGPPEGAPVGATEGTVEGISEGAAEGAGVISHIIRAPFNAPDPTAPIGCSLKYRRLLKTKQPGGTAARLSDDAEPSIGLPCKAGRGVSGWWVSMRLPHCNDPLQAPSPTHNHHTLTNTAYLHTFTHPTNTHHIASPPLPIRRRPMAML